MMTKFNLTSIKAKSPVFIGVLALIVFVLLIVIVKSLIKPSRTSKIPKLPTEVTPIPQPSGFKDELSKINSSLPHKTSSYSIEYFKPGNLIRITVTTATLQQYSSAKTEAENFIKSKGVQDICKLNIFWSPDFPVEFRKSLKPQDVRTTGCLK